MARKRLCQGYMLRGKRRVCLFMVQIVLVRIRCWISLCLEGLVLIISRKHLSLVHPQLPVTVFGVEADGVGKPHKPVSADLGAASIANLDKLRQASGPEPTAKIRLDMQKVMQTYPSPALFRVDGSDVSVFRTEESLQEGVKKITEVDKRFANVGVKDRSMIWNTDLVETLELQNLLTCATVPPLPVSRLTLVANCCFGRCEEGIAWCTCEGRLYGTG